jgi:hypothetical protein
MVTKLQKVVDDENGALVSGQPPEATLELVASGEGLLSVPAPSAHDRDMRNVYCSAAAFLQGRAIAGAHEQLLDPGVEAVGVAKPADGGPGAQQRLLDGILGQLIAPEDQPGDIEEAIDGTRDQRREGLMVAALCPDDEVSLHTASRTCRPLSGPRRV